VPMTRQTATCRLVLALILASAACTTACRQPAVAASGAESAVLPAGTSPYDAETTDIARVLGGMPPVRTGALAGLLAIPEWRAYEAEARTRWSAAWSSRWEPVRGWARVELKDPAGRCQTLLHPFGEASFLPAFLMFPACEGYVLVGSEPVGQMPAFTEASSSTVAAMADEIRRSFPGVFAGESGQRQGARSRPARPGALRLLLVQLAHLDARIIHASRFDLASNGRPLEAIPIQGGNARPAALSLTFEVPGGRPQSLVYLPADLDDAAMRRRPGVWTFLKLQAPFTTLLAPAGALGGDQTSILRALVLDQSRAILQDRSVIPGHLLVPRRWRISTPSDPPNGAFGPGASPTLAVRRAPNAGRGR
jgi:hypothetical protein